MPLYEYQCTHCGKHSEFLQKINEAPMQQCPHCQNQSLNRIISPAGFQLKGSGWYVTDFKDKPKAEKPASDKTETKKDEKATTSVTTDKPKD